jgi:hypothetical protein
MTTVVTHFEVTAGPVASRCDRRIGCDPRDAAVAEPTVNLGREPSQVSRLDCDRHKNARVETSKEGFCGALLKRQTRRELHQD